MYIYENKRNKKQQRRQFYKQIVTFRLIHFTRNWYKFNLACVCWRQQKKNSHTERKKKKNPNEILYVGVDWPYARIA